MHHNRVHPPTTSAMNTSVDTGGTNSYYAPPDASPRHSHLPQQHQFQARLPAMHADDDLFYPTPPPPPPSVHSSATFMLPRMAAHQYTAAPLYEQLDAHLADAAYHHEAHASTSSYPSYTQASPTYAHAHAHSPTHSPLYTQAATVHPPNHYAPPVSSSAAAAPAPATASIPSPHPSPTNTHARRHTTAAIGSYLSFATGPFAGRTVRAEIVEVQKADLGRKCADPPTSATAAAYASVSAGANSNAYANTSAGADPPSPEDVLSGRERRDGGRDRERVGDRARDKDGNRDREGDGEDTPARNVRKDRRPLDPPPVVALKYFEAVHYGTEHQYEREVPADDVEIGGLICQVDLFRVTIPPSATELASMQEFHAPPPPAVLPPLAHFGPPHHNQHQGQGQQNQQNQHQQQAAFHASPYTHPFPQPHQPQAAYSPYHASAHAYSYDEHGQEAGRKRRRAGESLLADEVQAAASASAHEAYDTGQGPGLAQAVGAGMVGSPVSPVHVHAGPLPVSMHNHARHAHAPQHATQQQQHQQREDVGWESASPVSPLSPYAYPAHPAHAHLLAPPLGASIDPDTLPLPTEENKLTRVLFGEYYSHAASILDLKGKNVIYFVFSDLSVKLEGLFRPRYRFFDLFSRTSMSEDVPVLAECFGGTFAVYSTKEFPGLKASTELTKHLSRWGIRVNIRETERKRRGGPSGSGPGDGGALTASGGRRGSAASKRGRSASGTANATAGTGARGSEDEEESEPATPAVVLDAPRRYLEGAGTRGRGRGRTREGGRDRDRERAASTGGGRGRRGRD